MEKEEDLFWRKVFLFCMGLAWRFPFQRYNPHGCSSAFHLNENVMCAEGTERFVIASGLSLFFLHQTRWREIIDLLKDH